MNFSFRVEAIYHVGGMRISMMYNRLGHEIVRMKSERETFFKGEMQTYYSTILISFLKGDRWVDKKQKILDEAPRVYSEDDVRNMTQVFEEFCELVSINSRLCECRGEMLVDSSGKSFCPICTWEIPETKKIEPEFDDRLVWFNISP